ncbi:TatD family hydrolase [Alkalibacter mobilis]|uniref:TatD family hydrolase n=1 Tax=Alkalibacter mobilis TaxID=2787712 RepID=UPI00189C9C13|nr:TatD family hydrolase [Alkalibacter mobilis]MBF7096705.1 TatD family hydrolase [Alkalibacter mobilis]
MLIDTHAHMDDERYIGILDDVINEFMSQGGKLIINSSYDKKSIEDSIKLSEKYPIIYSTAGLHPHDAKTGDEEFFKFLEESCKRDKVVGVGEIGLDYYYDHSPRKVQQEMFLRQLLLAEKLEMPVAIHSRDAHKDTYDILKKFSGRVTGVMHSYSGSWEMAKNYLDLGYYISFSGPVTFKNSRKLPEVASKVPLDRILVETDSPYLTPVPFRGRTNTPSFVKYVAEKVADIREISFDSLMEAVEGNVRNLFGDIKF